MSTNDSTTPKSDDKPITVETDQIDDFEGDPYAYAFPSDKRHKLEEADIQPATSRPWDRHHGW
jgi:hypothetical protein